MNNGQQKSTNLQVDVLAESFTIGCEELTPIGSEVSQPVLSLTIEGITPKADAQKVGLCFHPDSVRKLVASINSWSEHYLEKHLKEEE